MAGRGLDMTAVLTKAFAFVAIIAMGYILKRVGFFHAKDFYLISNIVIKITLPAAIVSNFSKITMDYSLLAIWDQYKKAEGDEGLCHAQYVGLQYRQFHHALCAELFKPCGICGHQSV